MQKPANSVQTQEVYPIQLTKVKRVCRILYFFFQVGLVYVDILFLFEISTSNDHKPYFSSMISFLIIPQAILFILNIFDFIQFLNTNTLSNALSLLSFNQIKQGCSSNIARAVSSIHFLSIIIGIENFFLSIYTSLSKQSTIYLEKKYFRSNLIHGIDTSICIFIIQCHFFFGNLDDPSLSYRYYFPIILRAFQFPMIFLGNYQDNNNSVSSSLKSSTHDFLLFTFEGIGRALMIGSTAKLFIFDPSFSDSPVLLTQEILIIEVLVCTCLGFSVLFYITFNQDFYCGIIYISVLIHQCLLFRIPNTLMSRFNTFYTTISKQNVPVNWQLRFLQLIPIVWRIIEIISIFLVMNFLEGQIFNRFKDQPSGKLLINQMLLISVVINSIQTVLLSYNLIKQCLDINNTLEISPLKQEANRNQQIEIQPISQQNEQFKQQSPCTLILNKQLINNPYQKQQLLAFPENLEQNKIFPTEIHNYSDEVTTRSNNTH